MWKEFVKFVFSQNDVMLLFINKALQYAIASSYYRKFLPDADNKTSQSEARI